MTPELSRLTGMIAAHVYSLNQPPEEEALAAALQYAKNHCLTEQTTRLFGRNIYLTDKTEPHGYEYLLTAEKIDATAEADVDVVSGGYFAVLEVKPFQVNRRAEESTGMG